MALTNQQYGMHPAPVITTYSDEKARSLHLQVGCEDLDLESTSMDRRCQCVRTQIRHRQLRMAAIGIILSLALILLLSLLGTWDVKSLNSGTMLLATTSLVKREAPAADTPPTTTGSASALVTTSFFIDQQYNLFYAIVLFFIVAFFAIRLTGWCCRGVFENPLCCPCYTLPCFTGLGKCSRTSGSSRSRAA
ncbi:hypothetical protein C8Q76DRAFT_230479 [Earliella scabrosa]|nr:hypothetical protein C8Q76DRAFT_230479 [Earliella scabrosa]